METFGGIGDLQAIQGGLDPSGRTSGTAPTQQEQDDYARATANIIAAPIAGDRVGRSNIRNAVNYDPLYAQALNISQNYLPGNQVIGFYPTASNFQGVSDLAVPSALRPTIRGDDGRMYYSEGERFLQETLPNITQNVGIMPLLAKLGDNISSSFGKTKKAVTEGFSNFAKNFGIDKAYEYLTNSSGGMDETDIANINMNQDPMPGGGRPAFISDFEVTRAPQQRPDMLGIAGVLPPENRRDMENNIGFTPFGDEIILIDRSPSSVKREVISQNISPNFPMEGQRPEDLMAYFEEQNRLFDDARYRSQLGS
mgnify:FL=1